MKFAFENLGAINQGTLELADLTLLCGTNNTGKTHLVHSVYGLLQYVLSHVEMPVGDVLVEALVTKGSIKIELNDWVHCVNGVLGDLAHDFGTKLSRFFAVPAGQFEGVKLDLMLDVETLDWCAQLEQVVRMGRDSSLEFLRQANSSQLTVLYQGGTYRLPTEAIKSTLGQYMALLIIGDLIPHPFVITAERMGISLFGQELRLPMEFYWGVVDDERHSKYSKPIFDNVCTLRQYQQLSEQQSLFAQQPQRFQPILNTMKALLGGQFALVGQQLVFQPFDEQGDLAIDVPLHLASSAVKSLLLLDIYINHLAQFGELLVLEEPELNLHPRKVHMMTTLITLLANAGIRLLVTTHSEHFICELNNRLMLSNEFDNRDQVMLRVNINDNEVLTPNQVKAYMVSESKHELNRLSVDLYGVNLAVFEELITDSTFVGDEVYYGLEGK